jgi:hypothetical protein
MLRKLRITRFDRRWETEDLRSLQPGAALPAPSSSLAFIEGTCGDDAAASMNGFEAVEHTIIEHPPDRILISLDPCYVSGRGENVSHNGWKVQVVRSTGIPDHVTVYGGVLEVLEAIQEILE